MTPSPPIPKLRSHSETACSAVSPTSVLRRLSMRMKSFPRPWYFTNSTVFVGPAADAALVVVVIILRVVARPPRARDGARATTNGDVIVFIGSLRFGSAIDAGVGECGGTIDGSRALSSAEGHGRRRARVKVTKCSSLDGASTTTDGIGTRPRLKRAREGPRGVDGDGDDGVGAKGDVPGGIASDFANGFNRGIESDGCFVRTFVSIARCVIGGAGVMIFVSFTARARVGWIARRRRRSARFFFFFFSSVVVD